MIDLRLTILIKGEIEQNGKETRNEKKIELVIHLWNASLRATLGVDTLCSSKWIFVFRMKYARIYAKNAFYVRQLNVELMPLLTTTTKMVKIDKLLFALTLECDHVSNAKH